MSRYAGELREGSYEQVSSRAGRKVAIHEQVSRGDLSAGKIARQQGYP
jgi:hypothetical protein